MGEPLAMLRGLHVGAARGARWLLVRLLALLLLLGGASAAHAGTAFCRDYPVVNGFYVIDGNDPAVTPATLPSSISIDATDQYHCYIKNFPISAKWPQGLTSTVNFANGTTGLVVFENVYYTGNMACSNTQVKIWFANGAFYAPANNNACQDLFIPIEAVSKRAPGPTATVGVPFTYTITVPVMYDPGTGSYFAGSSPNTLSHATIYDDLTATGASLSYVSNTAFLVNGGTRTPIGSLALGASPATLTALGIPASDNTRHIVFSWENNPALDTIAAGTQIEIQMTVVLDNVVPPNTDGTMFINTAKWWFGRVIDGVRYEPLPGQSGSAPPMVIDEPDLRVQKSGSHTNLNVGTEATFRLNVQNLGSDAWNVTVTDLLPAGMRAFDPTPTVTAAVYAADGTTQLSALSAGTHYTVSYSSATGQLRLTLANTVKLAPTQRLIITYRSKLDTGVAQGVALTNVAGATQWFNAAAGTVGRRQYGCTLTDGTPGSLDCQDAFTVTSTIQGYFFLKAAANLTSGEAVAKTAFPGDRLRYTLQFQNFTLPPLNNISVTDDLDALNASAAFVPGSLALVGSNLPAGATLTVNPTGGTKGTGSVAISGLNLLTDQQFQVQFDVTLASGLASGATVRNQGRLRGTDGSGTVCASCAGVSDDPYVNGPSQLGPSGDPTAVLIRTPALEFRKTVVNVTTAQNPGSNARPGEWLRYTVTARNRSTRPLANATLSDELDRLNAAAMFAPGTLRLISAPAGATSSVNPNGGAKGTGLLVVSGLNLAAQGSAGDNLTVVFEVQLAPAINSGTVVLNQARLTSPTTLPVVSDDPNVNGADNPAVSGDEDPTRTLIGSNPAWQVKKVSQDLTGDPAVLRPGDRLRYTITVKNVGTENATGVTLRDLVPVNTTYVAGSTTLNGVAVPDAGGASPMQAGMTIRAPEDATPGAMRADATTTQTNVATVVFDVQINAGVLDGTLISNQGFVNGSGAASGPFAAVPSDDPRTSTPNDPTRDIVGPYPLLIVRKTVALQGDANGNGVLDPLDTVRYTITVENVSGVAATSAVLTDPAPANTSYVADTTTLNGAGVGRPDGGVSPLAAGMRVNSPSGASGTVAARSSAVVTFDARVNAGVAAGTVISNQGSLATAELPSQLTDADGDSSNGFQPTTIIVGNAQQVSITKSVSVVGGGAALPGARLEYLVTATNIGTVAASQVAITDDLGTLPLASQVVYVAGSATLNGSTAGTSLAGGVLRADYAGVHGGLAPGASAQLRFRVQIATGLAAGTTITNTGRVAWDSPALTASASVSVAVGGAPGTASLNGRVWHDANLNKQADTGEGPLQGWTVEVLRNNVLLWDPLESTCRHASLSIL